MNRACMCRIAYRGMHIEACIQRHTYRGIHIEAYTCRQMLCHVPSYGFLCPPPSPPTPCAPTYPHTPGTLQQLHPEKPAATQQRGLSERHGAHAAGERGGAGGDNSNEGVLSANELQEQDRARILKRLITSRTSRPHSTIKGYSSLLSTPLPHPHIIDPLGVLQYLGCILGRYFINTKKKSNH